MQFSQIICNNLKTNELCIFVKKMRMSFIELYWSQKLIFYNLEF